MKLDISTLTIATFNEGKVREYDQLLGPSGVGLISLSSFSNVVEVEETGSTFADNARLKAMGYAPQTSSVVLADDSGLEIDALGGRPGVHSARYGGEISFAEKMELLLAEIRATGSNDRRARFVCCISIARPDGMIAAESIGICNGTIAAVPHGNGGFGYDPIFVPDGLDKTFAELSDAEKHSISHRAAAILQIIPILGVKNAI